MLTSTKRIELGSCAFRQPRADSHCKYLHGYQLNAKFWFQAKELDHNNWVVDFGGLKGLKKILQEQFDHTTCISYSDPHVETFKQLAADGVCDLRLMDGVGIEKFAEWCAMTANKFVSGATDNRCRCVKVEVFEHGNNSAIYIPEFSDEPQQTSEPVAQATTTTDGGGPVETTSVATSETSNVAVGKTNPNKPGTVKTTNSWVDPKYRGKTKNTWLF